MKTAILLSLPVLLALALGAGRLASASPAGVTIQGADAIYSSSLVSSAHLSSVLNTTTTRVVAALANASFVRPLTAPALMASALEETRQRVVTALANASFVRSLTAPTVMAGALDGTRQRVITGLAQAGRIWPVVYPRALINDTTTPLISGIEQVQQGGITYLRWSTDEFTTYIVRYGRSPGASTVERTTVLYDKLHWLDIMDMESGVTYYVQIAADDRSDNRTVSPEFTAQRATTRYLYLPMVRK